MFVQESHAFAMFYTHALCGGCGYGHIEYCVAAYTCSYTMCCFLNNFFLFSVYIALNENKKKEKKTLPYLPSIKAEMLVRVTVDITAAS